MPFAVPVSKTVAPMIGWPFVSITLPEISIVLESWVSATGAGDSAAVAEFPPPMLAETNIAEAKKKKWRIVRLIDI